MELLSSYNAAAQLQEYVCDALSKSDWLSSLGINFYPENSKDIEYQIKNALTKQGLACIVMTPELVYQGHDGADICWDAKNLTLQIVEFPPVNRASNKLSVVTALDVANFCENYLGGPQCGDNFGKFCPVKIEQGEDEGLLVVKAVFDTTIMGQIGGKFDWDGTHVILNPYLDREELNALSLQWTTTWRHWTDIWSDISVQVGKSELNAVSSYLDGRIDDVESDIEGIGENINDINGNISYLSGRISANTDDINDINRDIDYLSGEIDTRENQLTGKIEYLSGVIDNLPISGVIEAQYVKKFSENYTLPDNEIITSIKNVNGHLSVYTTELPGTLSTYIDEELTPVQEIASQTITESQETVPVNAAVYNALQAKVDTTHLETQYPSNIEFIPVKNELAVISADYLKNSDKNELTAMIDLRETKSQANLDHYYLSTAIEQKAENSTVINLNTRVTNIEADYLDYSDYLTLDAKFSNYTLTSDTINIRDYLQGQVNAKIDESTANSRYAYKTDIKDWTLSTQFTLFSEADSHKLYLRYLGQNIAEVNVENQFSGTVIQNVELVTDPPGKDPGEYIKITFKATSSIAPIYISVAGLIPVYTAGEGLNLENYEFSLDFSEVPRLSDFTAVESVAGNLSVNFPLSVNQLITEIGISAAQAESNAEAYTDDQLLVLSDYYDKTYIDANFAPLNSYNNLNGRVQTLESLSSGFELTSNKIQSITSSSTITQYPSGKAVYDYVENKIGDIESILISLRGNI